MIAMLGMMVYILVEKNTCLNLKALIIIVMVYMDMIIQLECLIKINIVIKVIKWEVLPLEILQELILNYLLNI